MTSKEVVNLEVTLAIALLEIALEKGVPIVISAIQDLNKEEISLEDIQGLREKIKPPDEY